MPCPRRRNRSRLSLSDSIGMIRLRESQKEKQRRHEDDSVNLGEKGLFTLVYVFLTFIRFYDILIILK